MIETLWCYQKQNRFALHAFVVMPDHVHILITPASEVSLERTIQFIKGGFSYRLKSKMAVWERGHFDKRVPDRSAFHGCISYIHQNPVKEGLARDESAYPFSSAVHKDMVDPAPDWFR